MKKIHLINLRSSTLLSLVFIFSIGSSLIFPSIASAVLSNIVKDPDPCIDLVSVAVGGASEAGASAVTVPVHDALSSTKLSKISSSECETAKNTAAVKDKTVGNTVFGIPVPYTSWDSIAKLVIKKLVVHFTNSTVDWINSGFDGNPNYITDPGTFFKNIADNVSGEFINGAGLNSLCTPFQNKIRLALRTQHISTLNDSYQNSSQCTLSKIGVNLDKFYGDFHEGGWNGWFEMTQNDANNPYGAYLSAEIELNGRVAKKVDLEKIQADWNKGFLSTKDCIRRSPISDEQKRLDPTAVGECLEYGPTKTPGSVIETQLNKTLGQGVDDLGLARSFDDLVSALVGALTKKVFNSADGIFNKKNGSYSSETTSGAVDPINFDGKSGGGTGNTGTSNTGATSTDTTTTTDTGRPGHSTSTTGIIQFQ